MMTKEENELITKSGPGTPCGELMRHYWQPVALSEELPEGHAQRNIKLFSEDLVLFRDDQGRPGLLGIHCSHRGADLSYGRLEDGGLRCLYHGWLYDIHGRCLEQPGEPGGGEHRESIRHLAYPCQERAGIIFTYMGPGEPPLLPNYPPFLVPDEKRLVTKFFLDCNYLQSNEGNIDPVHLSFLHKNLRDTEEDRARLVRGSKVSKNTMFGKDSIPTIDVELTDFGVRIYSVRKASPSENYLRVTNFVLPNLSAIPGPTQGEGYSLHWHVPIDDTHHWRYNLVFNQVRPITDNLINRERSKITDDYRLIRNKANRYQQDREAMKTVSFSGIGFDFVAQDSCVTEGPGPIQDRTREHIVSTDKAIVAARKLILKAIGDVQNGREAAHVIRDPALNRFGHLAVLAETLPSSVDWKEYTAKKLTDNS